MTCDELTVKWLDMIKEVVNAGYLTLHVSHDTFQESKIMYVVEGIPIVEEEAPRSFSASDEVPLGVRKVIIVCSNGCFENASLVRQTSQAPGNEYYMFPIVEDEIRRSLSASDEVPLGVRKVLIVCSNGCLENASLVRPILQAPGNECCVFPPWEMRLPAASAHRRRGCLASGRCFSCAVTVTSRRKATSTSIVVAKLIAVVG